MNLIKKPTLSRLLSLILIAGAPTVAQAQNPPPWLGWGQDKAPSPSAPQSTGSPGTTPPTAAATAASQPLGAGYGGTASADGTGSGQAVIIQNLLESVSRLQEQVRDLRGQIEEQGNEINRLKKAQQSGFSSFDDRLSKLEQGGASTASAIPPAPSGAAPVPPPVPAPSASPAQAAPPSASENEKQQALYNAAFAELKGGHYEQAISGFQATIDAAPQGQWTPSALFWQGETYYVLQKRDQAEAAYQKILTNFPKSDRVPDALLKTGYIAYDENKNAQARAIFQKVIDTYPNSQAANLAKQRLARMTSEKR